MKQYSEFTKKYVNNICDALNEVGEEMDKISGKSFSPENFSTLTQFLQHYIIRSKGYFELLTSKGLINTNRCPYTGQSITTDSPSWSFMNTRRVYLSNEGLEIMRAEEREASEKNKIDFSKLNKGKGEKSMTLFGLLIRMVFSNLTNILVLVLLLILGFKYCS